MSTFIATPHTPLTSIAGVRDAADLMEMAGGNATAD
jgi:hypothetical protein